MAKMSCCFCKGDMEEDFTTHVAEAENSIVIVKNVPCLKCKQCGEVVYNGKVLKRLDQILDMMETSMTKITVFNY